MVNAFYFLYNVHNYSYCGFMHPTPSPHAHAHSFVKAPRVHWEFTTPRVLTMEFIDGGKVDNVEYLKRNRLRGDDVSGQEDGIVY